MGRVTQQFSPLGQEKLQNEVLRTKIRSLGVALDQARGERNGWREYAEQCEYLLSKNGLRSPTTGRPIRDQVREPERPS